MEVPEYYAYDILSYGVHNINDVYCLSKLLHL